MMRFSMGYCGCIAIRLFGFVSRVLRGHEPDSEGSEAVFLNSLTYVIVSLGSSSSLSAATSIGRTFFVSSGLSSCSSALFVLVGVV